MQKLKGLNLGKSGKMFDKSAMASGRMDRSVAVSKSSKSRRNKKPPGSLMDLSNDDEREREINGGMVNGGSVQDYISENDEMKEEEEDEDDDGESSNYMNEESDS
jgi:hypothetical protein